MKIKQLEWEKGEISGDGYTWSASTSFGDLYMEKTEENTWCVVMHAFSDCVDLVAVRRTEEEAKAAAQADFEKRVMACFETTDKSNFWG